MASSISESTAISVHNMQQHGSVGDHSQKPGNVYYPDGSGAAVAAAGVIGHWPNDPHQYHSHHSHQHAQQQGSNGTDTACSSPQDTPLVKIMQQQSVGSIASGIGSDPATATMPIQPTPPQSASSHGFAQGGPEAWRSYGNSYQQGMPMSASYPNPSFASPISAGIPIGLESSSFEQASMGADYYGSSQGQQQHPHHHQQQQPPHHQQQPPHPGQHDQGSAPQPPQIHHASSTPSTVADVHQLHYHTGAAAHAPGQQPQQHQAPPHHQQGHPHHHHFHQGSLHQDTSVAQFDPAAAAAAAANGAAYMGDFGHSMYGGGSEVVSAPVTATHLPPIDPTSGLTRQNSYFGIPGVPSSGAFDSMSAAAAAAAATSPYAPHAPTPNHYLAAAAARGHQPYPPSMMMGRFNLNVHPGGAPGAVPTPPPHSQLAPAGPPPPGMGGGSMSMPTTPIRPMNMPRVNSHSGQSSTSQRKRYLCTVCQKMFARPSTLATHMHSHTGEKPYQCNWDSCGKKFSVMSNLRRHQRIHERQRAKFANMQQQQQAKHDVQASYHNDSDSTSGSTTPLASQVFSGVMPVGSPVAQLGHHMLPPPPHFGQQPGVAANPGSAIDMQSPLAQHHHMMSHPAHQQHYAPQHQPLPHYQQTLHHPHQPPTPVQPQGQPQMQPPSTSMHHPLGSAGVHEEIPDVSTLSVAAVAAAAAIKGGNSTSVSESTVAPGASTSSSTVNPSTPQSSLKE
ncbi:hypothetical protein GGI07_003487 [Coemansia sp. Benny D115]|nr:hypothetical protein GGI07_003487 [Coemansia sp. Benny D115]